MSEEMLVRHCAPTLAGLKTGNMFTCTYSSREEVAAGVRALNAKLVKKGVCVLPLQYLKDRVLIYVYRPRLLARDFAAEPVRRMLASMGYPWEKPSQCLCRLIQRLRADGDYPHEIGLFLGYPPEDVAGFMENAVCGFKCVGCWKVYGDAEKAQRVFETYKKCTRVYNERWNREKSIERLIPAV